jgi:glycosyltransferase involved in cell wall biosynthesis
MATRGIDYTAAIHQSAGIGRYTREMVTALARSDSETSYRLFVAGAGQDFAQDKNLYPSLPGPNFTWRPTRLTERWLARLWYRLRLPLWIEAWTGQLDLFHAADFVLPPVKPGTRAIVTIHDLSFVRYPDLVMPGMETHLNKWVPHSVRRANHVIAVSEATRQDLIALYQTPPEKITTLYHGVTPGFKPVVDPTALAAVRQKYRLGENPFILSVSTIQPRKNYKRLIQAFAQIDSPFLLVIGGDKGWHYQDIFAAVDKLGLEKRVLFPGFVADADLPALYSAASLFAYPSLYEGFGLPLLEAMACGTPVVTSNQSSLPEVVGEAALLIDPYDVDALAAAMRQVLTDTDLQQKLSQAGQIQAKQFTWSKMATKLTNLYQKTLKKEHS